jgi:TRAP-type mannitol/chloroaromatic compound transport system permease small subunit
MGSGLAISLASNLTAEAAVDEWIGKYPALKELDREEVWFRPMMDTVSLRLLAKVPWGLKMRVFLGAGLSMLDMASDINVILLYTSTSGEKKYGLNLLGMLVACIAIQLLVVYHQNKTKPQEMLREMLIVLTGLKPG